MTTATTVVEKAQERKPKFRFPHVPLGDGTITKKQHVENGMALMDALLGESWALLINLDAFDIRDGDRCVLGQVIPPSEHGRNDGWGQGALGNNDLAETVGSRLRAEFDLNGSVSDYLFEYLWSTPFHSYPGNAAWKAAIRKRQKELVGSVEEATKIRQRIARERTATGLPISGAWSDDV